MTPVDVGVLIAAITLALTALGIAIKIGADRQSLVSEMKYIRRDLDQILKLYRLTPASELDRKRRR